MLRSAVRGFSMPLGRSTPTGALNLNNVGRRLLTGQAKPTPAQISRRWQSTSFQSTWTRTRYGTSQLGFASAFQNALRGGSRRGFRFTAWRRASKEASAQEPQSLGAKLKRLTKEYGWAAVGVYFGLSALDFPFCFLLVRFVGTETIGKVEHYVVSGITSVIPEPVRNATSDLVSRAWNAMRKTEKKELGSDNATETAEMATWSVQEAEKHNNETASLATQLALAYAIHKSLIFFRVPLTAAVTPKIVKTLRSWGWNIGKRTPPRAS